MQTTPRPTKQRLSSDPSFVTAAFCDAACPLATCTL